MAAPTKITYDYSFLDHTVNEPDVPQPGDQLDEAFAEVKRASDETIDRLNLIQRDDGDLANQSVGFDQLRPELAVGFKPPEPWEPNHAYVVRDTVFANNSFYTCLVSHTSGADFDADLASGKWSVVADFTEATTEAQAARDKAKQWAENPVDVPVEPGQFSAKHHAAKAAASATSSANSATASATSAADALAGANAAATSATNSANSATASANSASDALGSKNNAAASATTAANSANASATSAAESLASKNAAALSATNALASETNAETAADRAEAAAISVESPVSYEPQPLTPAQQGQAQANIGAAVLAGWRNKLINGNFDVWQRGIAFEIPAGGAAYVADRWLVANATDKPVTVVRTAFGVGNYNGVPGSPKAALGLVFASAPTTGSVNIIQRIEGARTLEGKLCTARSYVTRVGGNTTGEVLGVDLTQSFGTGGTPSPNVITNPSSLDIPVIFDAVTRERNALFTLPSIAGKTIGTSENDSLQLRWLLYARQAATYVFARGSLVEGDATTEDDPFAPRHIGQEFSLCERYYKVQRVNNIVLAHTAGQIYSASAAINPIMRATPTGTVTVVYSGNAYNVVALQTTGKFISVAAQATAPGNSEFLADVRLDAEL
ncbi:carbohydrate-binding protein [Brucella anthropi]|uniref:carbohydrate-binding protein n=1 Tax=Brucella anthropi TaxID=529 RepID=UPI003987ED0B